MKRQIFQRFFRENLFQDKLNLKLLHQTCNCGSRLYQHKTDTGTYCNHVNNQARRQKKLSIKEWRIEQDKFYKT